MQGYYATRLRGTNYLKVAHVWARSKCGNLTLKTPIGNLYQ